METDRAGSQALQGLRAAVLGSTSGIGRTVALTLAEAGANVIIHGRSHYDAAEGVAAGESERNSRSTDFCHVLCRPGIEKGRGRPV